MSQEVTKLSTGCSRNLQLGDDCCKTSNPEGIRWDFVHPGSRHAEGLNCPACTLQLLFQKALGDLKCDDISSIIVMSFQIFLLH